MNDVLCLYGHHDRVPVETAATACPWDGLFYLSLLGGVATQLNMAPLQFFLPSQCVSEDMSEDHNAPSPPYVPLGNG